MQPWTLATLQTPSGSAAAVKFDGAFYLLGDIAPLLRNATCKTVLQDWDASLPLIEYCLQKLSVEGNNHKYPIDSKTARLLTPVMYPDNLLAIGGNYSSHLKEMGLKVEKSASMPFFIRPPKTTLVGPGDTVQIPKTTKQFDWECELAVFVGRRLKNASKEEAANAVAGYAIGLDLSCRDLIKVDNDLKVDLVRGKGQDTMAPCGPEIMPAKFVADVNNLRIKLFLNDEKMMDAFTSEMLYKIDEQLSTISQFLTIQPGDILFSGSPAGSAGAHGGRWLKPGDRIHAEIADVGVLDVMMRDDLDEMQDS